MAVHLQAKIYNGTGTGQKYGFAKLENSSKSDEFVALCAKYLRNVSFNFVCGTAVNTK